MLAKKRKTLLLLGSTSYILMLYISYKYMIAPNFSYGNYKYDEPLLLLVISAYFFSVLPLLYLQDSIQRPSHAVHWLLYFIIYIPIMFIPIYTSYTNNINYIFNQMMIAVAYFLLICFSKIPYVSIPKLRFTKFQFWVSIAIVSICFYIYIISVFGFHFDISFDDVYDRRFLYREETNRYVAYALNWQSKVLNTLLIAIGLIRGKKLPIFIGFLGQLILFSITGQKSIFFSIIMIIGVFLAYGKNGKGFGLKITYGFTGLIAFTFIFDKIINDVTMTSLFVRRFIATPGLITGYYFDFFSTNPKALLGYGLFKSFVDYTYQFEPPFLIGGIYFGKFQMSANVNYLGDAYANFGYLGMIIFTIILGFVLWIIDSLSFKNDQLLAVLLISMTSWSLTDTALLTSLLTHGILLAILTLYLYPNNPLSGRTD
ncbi:oligosaccharide repeat unit polymerase [Bacillus wiedmannii]|uniref:oligosaccharide repeat unit polymerase n=1 Tax=Bacillus wiedmannii TaxID=1890302 RepID=UPI000BEC3C63|nr:oligosaccharide repeat unit polymerase [Bacillus wiedmannii]PDZ42949.1 hypothetical protein CON82_26360 [Bacillus wiedmannii]